MPSTSVRAAASGLGVGLLLAVSILLQLQTIAGELRGPLPREPRPIRHDAGKDTVFAQEIGAQFPSPRPLTTIGILGGRVFAGTEAGLLELDEASGRWTEVESMREPVRRIRSLAGGLWLITADGLHRSQEAGGWRKVTPEPVVDLCEVPGQGLLAVTGRRLYRVNQDGSGWVRVGGEEAPFELRRVAWHAETPYVLGDGRLTFFQLQSGRFGGKDIYDLHSDQAWDWGNLPSPETRDMASLESRLVIATDRGLGVLRGMAMHTIQGAQGLPYEDVLCVVPGFDHDLWVGTRRGLVREKDGRYEYLAGRRWLPTDEVRALVVDAATRSVYAATPAGVGVVRELPMTLAEKAAFYEEHLERWGQKRLGLVHKLEWDEGLKQFVREAGDNDGGYSGDYLAAQSYRYAVTRDPSARREATNTFHALRWLEALTGIRGFPARSVWVKGETGHKSTQGSGGYPAEWHEARDTRFEWKGDTSSDELCGHFYACTVFLELAAEGDELRQAKAHLANIADHLLQHHWQLVDVDGKPTRWGRWDPEYFTTDEGNFDRGLQSLELLSFMKTASVLTGEGRFTEAYASLVKAGYAGNTLRQRQTFPPENVAHFEDQLALWSYWNLLRFEADPGLRSIYRRSFERTCEVIRIEQNPWFNFVQGALTGDPVEVGTSLEHLREWPMDLRIWSYRNSGRSDLRTPPGYLALNGGIRPFSPREREPMRWDAWTMQADGGADGKDVIEPSSWLLAYWMGRYHGYLTQAEAQPTHKNQNLFDRPELKPAGASLYNGPSRPGTPENDH